MIITNKNKLDELIVKAVSSNYEYKDKKYSVTSMLSDFKEVILKRRHQHEIVNDVSEMVWLMFGTAFHEFMEKQEVDYVEVKENVYRFFCELVKETKIEYEGLKNGETKAHYFIKPKLKESHLSFHCSSSPYIMTGYSDLYNILTNEVVDYKTASVNKVLYKTWDDYIKQLKLYAVALNQMGYPCNKGRLIVFLKDWNRTKYLQSPKTYPNCPIYEISFEFTYGELAETKQWIENYFKQIEVLEQKNDDEIPECDQEVRTFGKKSTYAVMKNDNKKAVKSGFETKEEANIYIRYNKLDLDTKNTYWIQDRPSEEIRCLNYCDSCHWCHHFKNKYAKAFLVDEFGKQIVGFKDENEARYFQENVEKYKNLKIVVKEVNENDQ